MANPIIQFYVKWKNHFAIGPHPTKPDWWRARGRFDVVATLNPSYPKLGDIEYRQYIKGTARLTFGTWASGYWYPIGQVKDLASSFPIPPDPKTGASAGLKSTWKEDGLTIGSVDYRYGYRNRRMMDGTEMLDTYVGSVSPQNLYIAYDVPGMDGRIDDGTKIEFHLSFVGAIINKRTKEVFEIKQLDADAVRVVKGSSLLMWA